VTDHRQQLAWVRAYVDEKVVPLIEAMNDIPNVYTLYSCQGSKREEGYMMFAYDGPERDALAFFKRFSALETPYSTVHMEWSSLEPQMRFRLAFLHGDIPELTRIVRRFR